MVAYDLYYKLFIVVYTVITAVIDARWKPDFFVFDMKCN